MATKTCAERFRSLRWSKNAAAAPAGEERDHGNNKKDEKQDLGDTRSRSGDATKPEESSDNRDDKKCDGLVKH